MLAEGRLFSITSNSDNHRTIWDTWKDGEFPAGSELRLARLEALADRHGHAAGR